MHIVDATMFFCARSGGVKRYLLAKRAWLKRHAPTIQHTLLVPAPQGRLHDACTASSLALHLRDGYRFPIARGAWRRQLLALAPDLIEAADPYVPAWAVRQAADHLRVPSIAFFHSDMARMVAARVGRWIEPVARGYLRRLYDGFALVLAPSRRMHQQLLDIGIQHVRLQPLGVDTETFTPTRADGRLRTALGLDATTKLLVYAGRFAAEKNIPMLQSVAAQLGRGYHLVLIGGHARQRIDSNVTVLPYQRSAERLARWLASCDVFVHAGDSETYGLVVVEAMACGLPIVAAPCAALPELVDREVGLLAERASADALAEAVVAVCAQDRAAIGMRARERAANRHAWDAVFPRLLTHYSSVCARAPIVQPCPIGSEAEG